jgi:Mrp family chromosome partitioning ATPase/DUF971 family protein
MEKQVLDALSNIIDPDLNKDIVSLGFIKNLEIKNSEVSFSIELTTPACPVKDIFKSKAEELVGAIDGVGKVNVIMTAQPAKNPLMNQDKKNLENVTTIIAVSSCKGGVGKSTVAVNLAYSLKKQGGRVGIFDADVYGPSLPTMLLTKQELVLDGNDIAPIMYDDIKCMSFGYALDQSDEGPAILRGPMVSQIISQFLLQTKWGDLDYLIIDMPPGTGDVQLTLCQLIPITAAVIVTTPQFISFIDVVKGIEMFDTLKVPVLGAIENMSYFMVNGQKHFPFGSFAIEKLKNEFGFKNTIALELDKNVSAAGDKGVPFVKEFSDSENSKQFSLFTNALIREVSVLKHGGFELPDVGYNKKDGILFQVKENKFKINPKKLRLACRSALTRDEFTNKLLIDEKDVPDNIYPLSINPVGNYAFGVNWSDGHSSLFPVEQLTSIAESLN